MKVVSNSSCLIILERLVQLDILEELYTKITGVVGILLLSKNVEYVQETKEIIDYSEKISEELE